ncbi:hypothetical protein [Pseudomonas sp. MWU13-2100]|uniref:hypothetical protein n=1 Tax=Pseudomonas sp. MWU13-2100 TaxID=2935075 RepID=UPI00200F7EF8|nr:hypothetical protein [Pseudomonas sp. MWU13-2100]
MSDKKNLDSFGKQLITSVRDRSIEKFEKITIGALKSQKALELHKLIQQFDENQKKVIRTLIIESIDNTIFNFLDMIEQHEDNIKLIVSNKNINEISDGLSGELLTEDGWIERFSKLK